MKEIALIKFFSTCELLQEEDLLERCILQSSGTFLRLQ